MQGAQPILDGLRSLVVVLSVILCFVLAGTAGYFVYAKNAPLEP